MKAGEIEQKIISLRALVKKKLPVKLNYAIVKNLIELEKEYQNIKNQRMTILENSCKKDSEGKPEIDAENNFVFETNEAKNTAIAEVTELFDMDIELNLTKVNLDIVEKCDTVERYDAITGEDLYALDFMIEE